MTALLPAAWITALVAAAPPPQTLAQIPIYPGAVEEAGSRANDSSSGARDVATTRRVYRVQAAIDDVVKFYRERLGAREGSVRDLNELSGKLQPEESSPVVLEISPVNFDGLAEQRLKDGYESTLRQAIVARLKAIYAKARAPYRPGRWVSEAGLAWRRLNREGRSANFSVELTDDGLLDFAAGTLPNETLITIQIDEESRSEPAPREKPLLAEPSPAALGVPKYSGAIYDPKISAAMSSGSEQYYVFTTADPVEKVVSFYQRAIGKQGLRQSDGGAIIAVKGSAPWAELGIVIQPNPGTYPPPVKTMITVRHGEFSR